MSSITLLQHRGIPATPLKKSGTSEMLFESLFAKTCYGLLGEMLKPTPNPPEWLRTPRLLELKCWFVEIMKFPQVLWCFLKWAWNPSWALRPKSNWPYMGILDDCWWVFLRMAISSAVDMLSSSISETERDPVNWERDQVWDLPWIRSTADVAHGNLRKPISRPSLCAIVSAAIIQKKVRILGSTPD